MTSTTSPPDEPREVWLSGTETIRLVQDLIDIQDKEERGAGYTTRIASKLAYLALRVPGHKIAILDHFDSDEARRNLLQLVTGILDYLRVDYDVGTDGKLFNIQRGKDIWVRVRPLPGKVIP